MVNYGMIFVSIYKREGEYNMDDVFMAAIFGSIVSGAVVGAIPAITGAIKGKVAFAIGGFFSCVAASIILGLILSIPVCAIFMYLIFKKNSNENKDNIQFDSIDNVRFCSKCGTKLSGDDSFCPKCGSNQKNMEEA